MDKRKRNAVVAQSGGMTAAINATLAGVCDLAAKSPEIGTVYGALHGIEGIINDRLTELALSKDEIFRLKITPGGYLGTCRYKLPDVSVDAKMYKHIFDIFGKYDIGYFFYIGGNDSMDTADKLSRYAKEIGYDISIIGLPKTIDNDLPITDHTPGFGSAAKFICASCVEVFLDVRSFDIPYIIIIEAMGRNAGWLAAASALVREQYDTPDLIYLPEAVFDLDRYYADVKKVLERKEMAFVVISEGIKTADGNYFCEQTGDLDQDRFGHKNLGGSADLLGKLSKDRFGCKVRTIELDLLQRCAGHFNSATDINESFELGRAGVRAALSGQKGVMMTIERLESLIYSVDIGSCPLSQVANAERRVPLEWINKEQNFVTKECNDYIRPLIQGWISPMLGDGIPNYLVHDGLFPNKGPQ